MARTFHEDNRTFSNFQPSELVKLCGVSQGRWPIYVAKELLDNAAAALEEHRIKNPMIRISIDEGGVSIFDNGPGIADVILDKVLDFDSFGGSNRHHKLPTRGAQGNAIMTIIGIASIWNVPVELSRPCGPKLSIYANVDPVRQEVSIEREIIGEPKMSGIELRWPDGGLPCKRYGVKASDIEDIVRMFAQLNPHITFMVRGLKGMWSLPRVANARPAFVLSSMHKECGSASWFTVDEFADRLAADVRARPGLDVAQWLREFEGMAASIGACSSDWGGHTVESIAGETPEDVTVAATELRRWAIAAGSNIRKPRFDGIGQARMFDYMESIGADSQTIEYNARSGTFERGDAEIPYIVEVAVAQMPDGYRYAPDPILGMNRTVLYGSPTFSVKWREKVRGQWHELRGDLGALCRAYQIDHGKTPAAVMVHITCPSPGYSGYGKQQFDTAWLNGPLSDAFEESTRRIRQIRSGEARRKNEVRHKPPPIRDELFRVLPGVLHENTEGGKLPILIRQLYYATRKLPMWSNYDRGLQYGTFCAYVNEYELHVGHQVCLKDPRGTLIEPHSGRELRLGTDAVDRFKPTKWEGHTIIFVEKEGFAHLLKAYRVTKRWDAIIVGSKGFAVESCRTVLQKYKRLLGDMVKIIALHDADPAGYLIGYDLATNLPRFGENVDVEVIDVGLTIEQSIQLGLQDEPFNMPKTEWTKINNMRRKMVTDAYGLRKPLLESAAWDAFMPRMYRGAEFPHWADRPQGRRVELNSMAPRQFIEWLEGHLEEHGCRKVRPPDDIIDDTLRRARENAIKNEAGELFMRLMGQDVVMEVMRELGVPAYDLDEVLDARPEQHWHYLVKRAGETGANIGEAVERVMRARLPGAFV